MNYWQPFPAGNESSRLTSVSLFLSPQLLLLLELLHHCHYMTTHPSVDGWSSLLSSRRPFQDNIDFLSHSIDLTDPVPGWSAADQDIHK